MHLIDLAADMVYNSTAYEVKRLAQTALLADGFLASPMHQDAGTS